MCHTNDGYVVFSWLGDLTVMLRSTSRMKRSIPAAQALSRLLSPFIPHYTVNHSKTVTVFDYIWCQLSINSNWISAKRNMVHFGESSLVLKNSGVPFVIFLI